MENAINDNSKDLYTLSFKLENKKKKLLKHQSNLPFSYSTGAPCFSNFSL